MAFHEFFKKTVLLFSITALLIHTVNEIMYKRELPSGRRTLCDRCPPGSCMQNNCTETQPTECRRCNEASTNSGVCRLCPHGFGVKEKGTPHKDTVCEVCKNGYHAAGEPGNTRCVQNTVCKSEEKLQIHGSNCLDNMCVTCKNIIHQETIDAESRDSKLGWVNLTFQCLLEILKMHNNLEPQESINGLEIFDNDQELHSIPDKDAFIHRLHRWFSRASEEQVHKLPNQLQKAGIKKLSQKIRNRSHRILFIMMMMFLQFYSERRQ